MSLPSPTSFASDTNSNKIHNADNGPSIIINYCLDNKSNSIDDDEDSTASASTLFEQQQQQRQRLLHYNTATLITANPNLEQASTSASFVGRSMMKNSRQYPQAIPMPSPFSITGVLSAHKTVPLKHRRVKSGGGATDVPLLHYTIYRPRNLHPLSASAAKNLPKHIADSLQSRPPLICIAGGPGMPCGYFMPLIHSVNDRSVIVYDAYGCGRSNASPIIPTMTTMTTTGEYNSRHPFYDLDDMVLDFATLMDDIPIPQYHLLGHSLGGIIAYEYIFHYDHQGKNQQQLKHTQVHKKCLSLIMSSTPSSVPDTDRHCQKLLHDIRHEIKVLHHKNNKSITKQIQIPGTNNSITESSSSSCNQNYVNNNDADRRSLSSSDSDKQQEWAASIVSVEAENEATTKTNEDEGEGEDSREVTLLHAMIKRAKKKQAAAAAAAVSAIAATDIALDYDHGNDNTNKSNELHNANTSTSLAEDEDDDRTITVSNRDCRDGAEGNFDDDYYQDRHDSITTASNEDNEDIVAQTDDKQQKPISITSSRHSDDNHIDVNDDEFDDENEEERVKIYHKVQRIYFERHECRVVPIPMALQHSIDGYRQTTLSSSLGGIFGYKSNSSGRFNDSVDSCSPNTATANSGIDRNSNPSIRQYSIRLRRKEILQQQKERKLERTKCQTPEDVKTMNGTSESVTTERSSVDKAIPTASTARCVGEIINNDYGINNNDLDHVDRYNTAVLEAIVSDDDTINTINDDDHINTDEVQYERTSLEFEVSTTATESLSENRNGAPSDTGTTGTATTTDAAVSTTNNYDDTVIVTVAPGESESKPTTAPSIRNNNREKNSNESIPSSSSSLSVLLLRGQYDFVSQENILGWTRHLSSVSSSKTEAVAAVRAREDTKTVLSSTSHNNDNCINTTTMKFVTLSNCSHYGMVEQEELYGTVISTFLHDSEVIE